MNQIYVASDLSVTFAVLFGVTAKSTPTAIFLFGDLSSVKHSWHGAEVDASRLPAFFFFFSCVYLGICAACVKREAWSQGKEKLLFTVRLLFSLTGRILRVAASDLAALFIFFSGSKPWGSWRSYQARN